MLSARQFFYFKLKKFKLFFVSLLVFLCFLFPTVSSFACLEELTDIITAIENNILPHFSQEEGQDCKTHIAPENLSFENIHLTKQWIKKLLLILRDLPFPEDLPPNSELFFRNMHVIPQRLGKVAEYLTNEPLMRLEAKTKEYFSQLFANSNLDNINFTTKKNGIQLGTIATITFSDDKPPVKYYIKTHRGGWLRPASPTKTSIYSAAPKQVDPKELFVYKVFELLDIGSEVHFFCGGGDAKEFYIATKDAGFSESTQEQKEFLVYEKLQETPGLKSNYENILSIYMRWRAVEDNSEDVTLRVVNELEDLNIIEQNIAKAITRVDIFTRVLRLRDCATNPGNIGFVWGANEDLAKFRIIDFDVPDEKERYRATAIFDGFLTGNGTHCRVYTDKVIEYFLYSRAQTKRVQLAKEILGEIAMTRLSDEDLDAISTEVKTIISRCAGFEDLNKVLKDLDRYVNGVKDNLRQFRENIVLWYTDDYIQNILEHKLSKTEGFIVVPPTAVILSHVKLFSNIVNNAITNALAGYTVVMPLYVDEYHWTSAVFKSRADGVIQLIYNDSLGYSMEGGANTFWKLINKVRAENPNLRLEVIDLCCKQQKDFGVDCGPFAVDNLIKIATYVASSKLDVLDKKNIISKLQLGHFDRDATTIRREHNNIVPFVEEIVAGEGIPREDKGKSEDVLDANLASTSGVLASSSNITDSSNDDLADISLFPEDSNFAAVFQGVVHHSR